MAKSVGTSRIIVPDDDDSVPEIRHSHSTNKQEEAYIAKWKTGFQKIKVKNETEIEHFAKKHKAKHVKKHVPGAERYEKNPNEPIKCP